MTQDESSTYAKCFLQARHRLCKVEIRENECRRNFDIAFFGNYIIIIIIKGKLLNFNSEQFSCARWRKERQALNNGREEVKPLIICIT